MMKMNKEKINYGAKAELTAFKKNRTVTVILFAFAALLYGFGFPSVIGILLYIAALFTLYTACSNVFKDAHDIPTADVQMSLPLNSRERYASRLLSIFYIWGLPFIISAAAGILLTGIFHNYDSGFEYVVEFNFRALLWYVNMALYIAAATVIAQCCVGSKAESKYMPILIIAGVKGLPTVLRAFVNEKFADYGYSSYSSVFGAVFGAFGDGGIWVSLVECLFYIGVTACGVLLYKRRDARSVGKPIVFSAFFETVLGILLIMLFCAAHAYGVSVSTLFIAWLGSIILRIIVSRKEFHFCKIFVWTGVYIVYYLAFLLFMFIAFKTGGFGALYKTPDIENLVGRNASVQFNVYYPTGSSYPSNLNRSDRDYEVSHWNEADIEAFFDHIKKYAKKQAQIKGFYNYQMFDGGRYSDYEDDTPLNENVSCHISIYVPSEGRYSDNSYMPSFNYTVSFCIPRSYAGEFENAFKTFESDFGLRENKDGDWYYYY